MALFDDIKKMAKKELDKQLKDPDNKKKAGDLFKKEFKKRLRRNLKRPLNSNSVPLFLFSYEYLITSL